MINETKYYKNKVIHFLLFGCMYLNVEVISRALNGALIGFNHISTWSLCGWTSLWMFPIGGLCGVLIGSLNDRPGYYNLKMWQQVLIGGSIITGIELLSGILFNIVLQLYLWDYSDHRFNFIGQICLENCILWYLITVVVVWLDDELSHYFYGDEPAESLLNYFKKLITLK